LKKTLIFAICIFGSIASNKPNESFTPITSTSNKLSQISTKELSDTNHSKCLETAFTNAKYIDEKLIDNLFEKSLTLSSFSFDNFIIVKLAGVAGEGILISNKYFKNYSLVVFRNGEEIVSPMLIETHNDKSIKYFDLNTGDSYGILNEKQNFSFVDYSSPTINSVNKKMWVLGVNDCGHGTAKCIDDAYTEQGWLSVWAFLQTLALPQTTVAIAITCAAVNCGGANKIRPHGEHR